MRRNLTPARRLAAAAPPLQPAHGPVMDSLTLGGSSLRVGGICLGTGTFGGQVGEADSHAILDRALGRGIDFIDTPERSAVSTRGLRRHRDDPRPRVREAPGHTPARRIRDQGRRAVAQHGLCARRQHRLEAGIDRAGPRRQPAPVADRRDRPLPDRLAEPQHVGLRRAALRPDPGSRVNEHARAVAGASRPGARGQGAPAQAVELDALGYLRIRPPGRAAWPAARGQRAEPASAHAHEQDNAQRSR